MFTFGRPMEAHLPQNIRSKNLLFSALNWGYGHVMRSIVLLKQFEKQNNTLFIACTEEQEILYKTEGIHGLFLRIDGYPFKFSPRGNFNADILMTYFRLKSYIQKEQSCVENWCKDFNIDLVIADQSIGFYSKSIPSIILTHQVNLPLRFWEKPFQWIYNSWLKRFTQIWIPDQAPPMNLAGKLSETSRRNAHYIGWLSRFSEPCSCEKKYEIGALITGPEPHAELFYNYCKDSFLKTNARSFIVYNRTDNQTIGNLSVLTHQQTHDMAKLLCSAEKLVTRSGYSTLMDLQVLGIDNVEFIPTTGQREQEYLAERLKRKAAIPQHKF